MRDIIFYETKTGEKPVKNFLDSLEINVVKKIAWTLKLIQENDMIPKTYFKKMVDSDGIWKFA